MFRLVLAFVFVLALGGEDVLMAVVAGFADFLAAGCCAAGC